MTHCTTCGSQMLLLFTSYVCDTCNPPKAASTPAPEVPGREWPYVGARCWVPEITKEKYPTLLVAGNTRCWAFVEKPSPGENGSWWTIAKIMLESEYAHTYIGICRYDG